MHRAKIVAKYLFQQFYTIVCLGTEVFPDNGYGNRARGAILGAFFRRRGRNLQISRRTNLLYPHLIEAGDDVYIGFGSWVNAQGGLVLGDEVMLGPYVCISTGNHGRRKGSFRFGDHVKKPVVLEMGVWLGSQSCVVAGVDIAAGSLIAAGGVVVKSIERAGAYGGVPVKLIKEFGEEGGEK